MGTWAALNTILGKVSQATGVSRELIIGGRNRRVAFVRSMFYYVARQEKYTCSLIGRAIGHRGAIVST
ncbi:MAG: hypothetical protein LBC40_00955, partial [Dysgonamonadaceae bacterium]|nr:hypothetical protein [Dysgonamonadaceae bacterium]